MAIRQYIGARYVPKFMGTYNATQAYEALTVVDNGLGTSYISKVPTPAGTPLTNTAFWAIYGASSGAIINLQNQIDHLADAICILYPTGDSSNRRADIVAAFADYNAILFADGDYYISSTITLPDNFKIIGASSKARLIYTGSANMFECGNNNEFASITMQGSEASRPTTDGTATAIYVTGKIEPLKIHDCNFIGFSHCGINVYDMGYSQLSSVEVENCFFKYNSSGITFGEHGEYGVINNCVFYENRCGASPHGGNNIFSGCSFVRNHFGVFIDGNNINNAAHGSIVGCTLNHNDYAIQINNASAGQNIASCVFHGNNTDTIEAVNSSKVNISGNYFGTSEGLGFVNSEVTIKGNTFANEPTYGATSSNITTYANSLSDGTPYLNIKELSKTYTTNAGVTATDFANGLKCLLSNGILTVRLNMTVSAPTGGMVQIGKIDNVHFAVEPVIDAIGSNGTQYLLYIHNNGVIELLCPASCTIRNVISCPYSL